MMMLSKTTAPPGALLQSAPAFGGPKTKQEPNLITMLPTSDHKPIIPALHTSLLQQIARAASSSLQNASWPLPISSFASHNEQTVAVTSSQQPVTLDSLSPPRPSIALTTRDLTRDFASAREPVRDITMCKIDPSLATHVLEQQLASQILERYSQQLSPSLTHSLSQNAQHFAAGTKLFSSHNALLSTPLSTTNALLSNQLTTTNTLLSNQLTTSHFLNSGGHLPGSPQPLILPRYTNLSPVSSPRVKDIIKSDEGNSRRLRWKEEHGRALIAIWKEKYPKVRTAKKIKEKHAIWQEIGDEYNKLCIRYDWPARSTDQVKIKVKNCVDEYKQTIKYNQEYKTCPYFQDIDDVHGWSDPEKSAELQKNVVGSQNREFNSDNVYWSGTSLPTQVKKRRLNISCQPAENLPKKSPKSSCSPEQQVTGAPHQQPASSYQQDVYLLPRVQPQTPERALHRSTTASEERFEVKIGGPPEPNVPADVPEHRMSSISVGQLSELLKQVHEREEKMLEVYHRIDAERRNAYLQRERERHEADYQLEKSRQTFLANVIEKLINVIKDRASVAEVAVGRKDLFPDISGHVAMATKGSEHGMPIYGAEPDAHHFPRYGSALKEDPDQREGHLSPDLAASPAVSLALSSAGSERKS